MPVTDLDVKYHQQDTSYYCGAACAQMVLATIGAGILDQDDLYADNHSHSTIDAGVNWATGPDGLTWTMMNRRPAAFTNSFVLFALNGEDAISRKICWTIHHYQVAPIALVFGWDHWIVVRGYDASTDPVSSSDTAYTINAFDLNNPWPPTPAAAAEPPHTAVDGCGTGGDRGIADEHVSYADWQDTYMTGVPGGYWAGKFIAVCDPEPPATFVGRQKRPDQLPGAKLITPGAAVANLKSALDMYRLTERKRWRAALQSVKPLAPLLVRRLDLPDTWYYIVPLQRSARRTTVVGRIDARSGMYRGAVALPAGRESYSVLAREKVVSRVADRRFELPSLRGRILVRKEAICLYPTLVWKPCLESLSPYWPFYMISVGTDTIYVRIDGAIFTALHELPGA
jgi:peptidase C39-like protein